MKTFDVPVANIKVEGEPEGYTVTVDDTEYETVSLTLQGLGENLGKITADSLIGTVKTDSIFSGNDTDELKEGNYSADVEWSLPEKVKAKGTVSVYVKVEKNN